MLTAAIRGQILAGPKWSDVTRRINDRDDLSVRELNMKTPAGRAHSASAQLHALIVLA